MTNSLSIEPCAHARSWIEVDRAALRHNARVAQQLAGKATVIAVLKANAYGHGIREVARTLAPYVSHFAVASLKEALCLREVEQIRPIMLLSPALPVEYTTVARHGFIPTISSFEEAQLFSKTEFSKNHPINFKINSGMGRLGVFYTEAAEVLGRIKKLPLSIASISTHLPSADTDIASTRQQLALFKKTLSSIRALVPQASVHVLNSAGLLRFADHAYDHVRTGLLLYGISPIAAFQKLLKPAMTWKTVVALINKIPKGATVSYGSTYKAPRDLTIAVLSVGYGDGYSWHLSGKKAFVLIQGKKAPILGRVTMDQVIVDISHLPKVRIGTEVVLLGNQGKETITATALAAKAETIPWHLFTGITERVDHRYRG
ncbi:MAG: alanine racemase [Chthoniobacterales bacterium]|nr:alanine racemase [Chthoniobacterales bacterium]